MPSKYSPGQTHDGLSDRGYRDALHVPYVMVTCIEEALPGMSCKFMSPRDVRMCSIEERQAIIDPFLTGPVPIGKLFMVFVCHHLVDELTHKFNIQGVPSLEQEEIRRLEAEVSRLEGVADDTDGCSYRGC